MDLRHAEALEDPGVASKVVPGLIFLGIVIVLSLAPAMLAPLA